MYYYYRLFHADIHESLEVCVWLEHLKSSREYFGKNNTTPPDWIKVQRDSRNVARGEKLVANELMRAMQLDTEVNVELIPDASSLFIPTGALEQLPPFARWYWSVKSQMMDCLVVKHDLDFCP